jgi:hypothetical protein
VFARHVARVGRQVRGQRQARQRVLRELCACKSDSPLFLQKLNEVTCMSSCMLQGRWPNSMHAAGAAPLATWHLTSLQIEGHLIGSAHVSE